jgi:hypothetical protein
VSFREFVEDSFQFLPHLNIQIWTRITERLLSRSDEKQSKQNTLPNEPVAAFLVFLKNLSGATLTTMVRAQMTVEELRKVIEAKTGIPGDVQRLVTQGQLLEDGHTLQDYGLKHDATIHILLRL